MKYKIKIVYDLDIEQLYDVYSGKKNAYIRFKINEGVFTVHSFAGMMRNLLKEKRQKKNISEEI